MKIFQTRKYHKTKRNRYSRQTNKKNPTSTKQVSRRICLRCHVKNPSHTAFTRAITHVLVSSMFPLHRSFFVIFTFYRRIYEQKKNMSAPTKRQRLNSCDSTSIEDEKRTEELPRCIASLDNIPTDILGTILDFLSLQTICRIRNVSQTFESNSKKALRRFTNVDCSAYRSKSMSFIFGIVRTIRDCCPNVESMGCHPNFAQGRNWPTEPVSPEIVDANDAFVNLLAELLENCPRFQYLNDFVWFVPPLDLIARTSADTVLAGIEAVELSTGRVEMIDLSQMIRKCPNISSFAIEGSVIHHTEIELVPLFDRYQEQLSCVAILGFDVIDLNAALAALAKLPNCTTLQLVELHSSAGGRLEDQHIAMLSPEFLRRLEFLDLSHNDITNATIDYLVRCGMPNLTFLCLQGCPEITDEMRLQLVDDTTNFPLLTSDGNNNDYG